MKKSKIQNVIIPFRQDAELMFRIGLRSAAGRHLNKSLKYFKKAVEKDKYNAEYQLNLACIYAEVGDIKKSNDMLMNIIKNLDPTISECYFGLACNYFDVGNFKKAREYFEKYICIDGSGQFVDEAYDVLYYLQIYGDIGYNAKKDRIVSRLTGYGERLIREGEYKKACAKLEKAIEIEPQAVSPRNHLSIAYFNVGDMEKAVCLGKSVLKLEACNITAHCNLTLFYAYINDRELYNKQLDTLCKVRTKRKDDVSKLIDTCKILKEHQPMVRILKRYYKRYKDFQYLRILVTALYNIKSYDEAEELLKENMQLYPKYSLIADYYSNIIKETRTGLRMYRELEYTEGIPGEEFSKL